MQHACRPTAVHLTPASRRTQADGGRVQTRIRGSYRSHCRRLLAPLLNTLVFRSNNERHRPVIEALALLERYLDRKVQYYPREETVPIDGVVPDAWRDVVVELDPEDEPQSTD